MSFRKDGIIILLGAGCSKEAGIPTSIDMINEIEGMILNGKDNGKHQKDSWQDYSSLYCYIKSSILYGEGIAGRFGNNTSFNIERLVNTLSELTKKEDHPIYPFIGNWNIKLIEVANHDFSRVKALKEKIVEKLKDWVTLDDYYTASYYSKLVEFKRDYNFPLRLFTLNYDLCLEKHADGAIIERGFDEERHWDWRRFEDNKDSPSDIFYYKMHGSIDWKRDGDNLTFSDEVRKVHTPDLIFGTNYKLQYIDPYLFFAYEFRRYSLESQLIVTIGYGFGDEHINGIIRQALKRDSKRRILCVSPIEGKEETRINEIRSLLDLGDSNQIILKTMAAKKFMEEELLIAQLEKEIPLEEDAIPFLEPSTEEDAIPLLEPSTEAENAVVERVTIPATKDTGELIVKDSNN